MSARKLYLCDACGRESAWMLNDGLSARLCLCGHDLRAQERAKTLGGHLDTGFHDAWVEDLAARGVVAKPEGAS